MVINVNGMGFGSGGLPSSFGILISERSDVEKMLRGEMPRSMFIVTNGEYPALIHKHRFNLDPLVCLLCLGYLPRSKPAHLTLRSYAPLSLFKLACFSL